MTYRVTFKKTREAAQLTVNEEREIEQKVEAQIARSHYSGINLGGIANCLSGIFIIWVLYGHIPNQLLFVWYGIIVAVSFIDSAWAFLFRKSGDNPVQLKRWRYGFYVILTAISLAWGSMGVLFQPDNIHYELYIITFLQVVVLGFCFTSVTDFTIALIAISCLLLPAIIYRGYSAFQSIMTIGYDPSLNLALSISLFILGAFLLAACFIGAKMVRRFFRLSFVNVALSQKLENMNGFLEQRVQERTLELENSLKQVTYQATHDLLTNLPNQRLILKFINSAIRACESKQLLFGVVFFSINELERINDGLGYHMGDFAIRSIARRFQKYFEELNNAGNINYLIGSFRKDRFVILIQPMQHQKELEHKIDPLFSILNETITISDQTLKLTASIGISLYPEHGKNAKSLLMNADAAMLVAKKQGGNSFNIYESTLNADLSKQLQLESYLHVAVKNAEFVLMYQPVVDLNTGMICSVEALIRWHHSTLGLIAPDKFIPLAEASGIIIALGEWVLKTACVQTKKWHEQGFTELRVAVNLSAKQLLKKNIIYTVQNILQETNLNPDFLELELTETEAFQANVVPIVTELKRLGVHLAIDDFGTGYSGLTNLKLFSIDKLKIDKSFVQDIETSNDSRAIVSHSITLAKKIHVKVVAEGVENEAQLKFLKDNGCDMIQGYYFSKPLSADNCTALLAKREKFNINI